MKTILIFCALVAALSLCGCTRSAEKAAVRKWEYKVVDIENNLHGYADHQTNAPVGSGEWAKNRSYEKSYPGEIRLADYMLFDLGNEGWELAGVVPEVETLEGEGSGNLTFANHRTAKVILIFKRPKE